MFKIYVYLLPSTCLKFQSLKSTDLCMCNKILHRETKSRGQPNAHARERRFTTFFARKNLTAHKKLILKKRLKWPLLWLNCCAKKVLQFSNHQ